MTLEVTGSNPVIYLTMLNVTIILETFDWAQKRFGIIKDFQKYDTFSLKKYLQFFYKKKHFKINWYIYRTYNIFIDFIKYIKLFKNKNLILQRFFKFLVFYNGIYRKSFSHLRKLRIYFAYKPLIKHGLIKFIFGPQQVFFQLFTKNGNLPDTHTTVGTLLRIRENIREHKGEYVYRFDETQEVAAHEFRRDKKRRFWFVKRIGSDNFRNLIISKGLIKTKLVENKEQKLQRVKKELLLKHVRKKYKNAEIVIVRNKRGNPKTEPLYGKSQRRKFSTWLWFIKCVILYIQKRNVKLYKNLILSISGHVKVHKQILKYILSLLVKANILIFLLKLNLKYRGTKLKHFTTIKKKTRKRLIKIEQNTYFR